MYKVILLFSGLIINYIAFAQPKPEFRAVWVATVDNIDWPSKGNYNSDSQKLEFIQLLDMHQRNGMNAVVAQIRPATDAFYPSPYEPWSEWLTGKQGSPPNPYYDPLQFMIDETHKRGMEFHAWCNPYRAIFNISKSSIAPTHITRLYPEWFLSYGDKKYFDPGNKEAQQFVVNVIRDIVSRYAVDAIHFDDYFYPYRIAGKEFPDDISFSKYNNGLNKEDWRRSNVDSIIVFLSRVIKEENKFCQFGISPFGIWRNQDKDPEGSATQAGQTNYDDLYADILLWLKNGWIDYVAPQIYFEIGHPRAAYEILLNWWSNHSYGKHCYIGLGIYKANTNAAWKDKTQLTRQIESLRNTPNIQGMIFFSSKSFNNNPNGWSDSLRLNYFKERALIPEMEWLPKKDIPSQK
ncbi:MAG: glycoside hydrolase family 10 protein [Chitinophagaceae bacterium]